MSQEEDANRTVLTTDSDAPCAAIKELWGEEQICPYKPSFRPPTITPLPPLANCRSKLAVAATAGVFPAMVSLALHE